MKISIPKLIDLNHDKNTVITQDRSQEVKFEDYLHSAIEKVDKLQKDADSSAVALAAGETQNLHNVMIDAQKAEIALQFTIQVRNKILEAYREIMGMQV